MEMSAQWNSSIDYQPEWRSDLAMTDLSSSASRCFEVSLRASHSFCTPYLFSVHSDSGDSIFLTQSESSASGTVKRRRPSNTQACPFSQESEDEQESDSNPDAQRAALPKRCTSLRKKHGQQPCSRNQRIPVKRMVFPFLKTSGSRHLSGNKSNTIVVRMCERPVNMKVLLKIN